jgi:hypothetical protein
MSVNAVLAFIEAAEPKNEMEAALAIQMACTHTVAMAVLRRDGGLRRRPSRCTHGSSQRSAIEGFATQVEATRRLRIPPSAIYRSSYG